MPKTRFHASLAEKIREEVDNRAASLARGAAKNYEQYQYCVGYTQAMQDVLKFCDEIEGDFE